MHLLVPHSTRVEHYRTRMLFPEDPPGITSVVFEEGLDAVVLLFPEGLSHAGGRLVLLASHATVRDRGSVKARRRRAL
jgi:hypothetical protein